jgi:membrane fusion protein (multidrug efflux system)
MTVRAFAAIFLGLSVLLLCGCESQGDSHEVTSSEAHGESGHGESGHGESGHEESGHPAHQIVVTTPIRKDVISTQQYVCQIHSCQHIEVRALEGGYLEKICVKEGQAVKKGELMFKILPVLYQAKLNSEEAEVQRLQIELDNAEALLKRGFVSQPEIALKRADLGKAKAKLALAKAELGFTDIKAPFDGIVDRQRNQLGSLISEGDVLTTLSDNSLMWVYFNVPEKDYLEYKAELDKDKAEARQHEDDGDKQTGEDEESHEHLHIELKLANHKIFPEHGKIGAIEADFNNVTGNIAFRADFPNPNGTLRNGQTGTILIHRTLEDVIVIPQRATYEILDKRYAFVVDENNVVHQRDIKIEAAQDDIFVLAEGLHEGEKIILEGIRQVRDGDTIEYESRDPEEVLSNLKYHAE